MSIQVSSAAIAASICLACYVGSASAHPPGESHDAQAICSAISETAHARPMIVAPTKARTESDKLVAEAATLMAQPSRKSVTSAIELLERSTAIDPDNAVAFARLSAAHGDSKRYADVLQPIAAARRWAAATRAYALDPDNVVVLNNLAHSVVVEARDLDCAERILLRARQISPLDPELNFGLSNLRGSKGDFDTAFADLDTAIANADPSKRLALQYNSGRLYFMARDYRRVINDYAALLETNPSHSRNWLAYFYRSLAFAAEGDYQQALAEVSKLPPGNDGDAGVVANFARTQILAGQRVAGIATLQLLLDRDMRGEHVVSYQIAAVYEALGNREETFRWLARYVGEVDGLGSWILWLQRDPRWDRLRDDPRFVAILAKSRPCYQAFF